MDLRMNLQSLSFVLLLSLSGSAAWASTQSLLSQLEKRIGGHIGLVVFDSKTRRQLAYRREERFSMCSTFKLLLAAHVLKNVDLGKEKLDRPIPYDSSDLIAHAPITSKHVKEGRMAVGELCAAALQYSDNTAANLLLKTQGGPDGLTTYLRSIGDPITRLDRTEPALNAQVPGKDFDTTTPAAMVASFREGWV